MSIPYWRQDLIGCQKREGSRHPYRWIQMATCSQNIPSVRTVVLRGWDMTKMEILTDSRTKKYKDILSNPNVELSLLFSRLRIQYRFQGTVEISSDLSKKNNYWSKLDDKEKMLWFWPSPGDIKDSANDFQFENKMYNLKFLPENFILLLIDVSRVEKLNLKNYPHTRKLWKKSTGWSEVELNP